MKTVNILFGLTIILSFSMTKETKGQWAYNGTHIFNTNAGNVGIGNNAPAKLFYVGKNMTEPTAVVRNFGGSGGATFEMIDDASGADWKFKATTVGGFKIRDNANAVDAMTFEPGTGYVGLGVADPYQRLHVNGYAYMHNTSNYTFMIMDLDPAYSSGNTGLWFKSDGVDKGWFYWDNDENLLRISTQPDGYRSDLVVNSNGYVGIGTGTPGYPFNVVVDGGNSSYSAGYYGSIPHLFKHYETEAEGDGQCALFAYRERNARNDGTGYSISGTNQGFIGYNVWGDFYTFGASGFNWNDYTRCGGILGAVDAGTYWGSLGYKDSGGTGYGGYFSSYTSGAGKGSGETMIGIGLAAWGDLIGADIHGKVYGAYIEGDDYAVYSHGISYKDNLDVHLQNNGDGTNTVMYTNVSTDVTVQTSGVATLSSGKTSIVFDKAFSSVVSAREPVIITVTPTGNCNGVYISDVTATGFVVNETNSGKSNVTVNYIAIGRRAGYEKPELAADVVDPAYNSKLARGLHADADLQSNGEGLYYDKGQLVVGIHPSTLPDPNKKVNTYPELKQSAKETSGNAGIAPVPAPQDQK